MEPSSHRAIQVARLAPSGHLHLRLHLPFWRGPRIRRADSVGVSHRRAFGAAGAAGADREAAGRARSECQ